MFVGPHLCIVEMGKAVTVEPLSVYERLLGQHSIYDIDKYACRCYNLIIKGGTSEFDCQLPIPDCYVIFGYGNIHKDRADLIYVWTNFSAVAQRNTDIGVKTGSCTQKLFIINVMSARHKYGDRFYVFERCILGKPSVKGRAKALKKQSVSIIDKTINYLKGYAFTLKCAYACKLGIVIKRAVDKWLFKSGYSSIAFLLYHYIMFDV